MATKRSTPRRPPQFGLRTLLVVVAAVAITMWLSLEFKFVLDRRRMLMSPVVQTFYVATPEDHVHDPAFGWLTIPIWRRFLGDEPVAVVGTADMAADGDDARALRRLFPEAFLYFGSLPREPLEAWESIPQAAWIAGCDSKTTT